MKILIACDVDPVLPEPLARRPGPSAWSALSRIDALAGELPRVTWLIRADASVEFATGDFDSGYRAASRMWEELRRKGHELGWHMHLMSRGSEGAFRFDPSPAWLEDAHGALARHFPVSASRTGWDYGSEHLFERLDRLGIKVDLSALPGNRAWQRVGGDLVSIDWLRAPPRAYHPSRVDYQRPGPDALALLEVPIAQFPNGIAAMAARAARRLSRGCLSMNGLGNKTKTLTQRWATLPRRDSDVLALFFHPYDLTPAGTKNLLRNVQELRRLPEARFVVASELLDA